MRLYGSLTSPFVRTVRIAAIELGLEDQIEFVGTTVRPTEINREYGDQINPLRRVPALETPDGDVIIDSRVIVENLNAVARGRAIPDEPAARIACFNRHAVVAGATEALVLAMYESKLRPEERRWPAWINDQTDKAQVALDWCERRLPEFQASFDLSAMALVSLVGYAQFRFPAERWIEGRSRLKGYLAETSKRASVAATIPPATA
ncbi:MAG: glutathione S-transferase [Alphaproteobacteria bacterium]|nr:glutathione S-transferase [Alphaproteobacteria bacterium]